MAWESTVARINQQPECIRDGNYGGTLERRLSACDTVIVLDTSPWLCLWRVLKRRRHYAGRSRPEMASGCPERVDAKVLWWVCTYPVRRLRNLLRKLETFRYAGNTIEVLRSASEVDDFLHRASTERSLKPDG